jgi:hypothetical protein
MAEHSIPLYIQKKEIPKWVHHPKGEGMEGVEKVEISTQDPEQKIVPQKVQDILL